MVTDVLFIDCSSPSFFPSFPVSRYERAVGSFLSYPFINAIIIFHDLHSSEQIISLRFSPTFFFTFAAIVSSNDYRDIRAASRKRSSACHRVFFTSTLRETFSSFFNNLTRQETSTSTRLTKITRHGRCFNG